MILKFTLLSPSLVVNVASDCGYTDGHYRALVDLHNDPLFEGRLNILAFPCNQFGYQETGSNEEIARFARTTYNVDFPLFSKVDVSGFDADPVWEFLTRNAEQEPTWNFWKYLVDGEGQVKGAWGPEVSIHSIYGDLLSEAVTAIPSSRFYDKFDDEF